MRVLWSDGAVAQLEAIHDYVAQTSPEYARRIVDKLTRRSIQIAAFPFSGRMLPEFEINDARELIEGSYRIIYLVKVDRIEVLAVMHGARDRLKPLD
ncbi:MAG TPA: type II toxin-antitoxin system RelE/ParE family toxin [Pyrinomonadaceae bacterium]|nr:type II toxin-antitoxin system RelE/ParE family toxin [Pyrinomonadaceae bacterium]